MSIFQPTLTQFRGSAGGDKAFEVFDHPSPIDPIILLITYYDYVNRIPSLALSRQWPSYILAGGHNDKAILQSLTSGLHLGAQLGQM